MRNPSLATSDDFDMAITISGQLVPDLSYRPAHKRSALLDMAPVIADCL
jgi:hypothetical protein